MCLYNQNIKNSEQLSMCVGVPCFVVMACLSMHCLACFELCALEALLFARFSPTANIQCCFVKKKKTGLALASGRAELSARARGTQVWTFFYFSDGRRMEKAQRISEKQGMGDSRRKTGEGPQRERDSGTNRTKKRQERRREEGRGGESDLTTTQHARRLQHAILQNPSLSALLAIRTRSRPKVTASSSRY